jgi:short-subunit dehydrogenase
MKHLITGAGSGIGAALAHALADRGDSLVLLARSATRAEDLSREFPGAQVLVADLADPGMLNGLGRQVDGPLDSVIHSAGVVTLGPMATLKLHAIEEQLAVNLVAPAVLTREFLPHLRAARGTVVFINSGAGLNANPEWGAYAASKFGLRAIADSLRAEEATHGVRVTSVFPGRTATPMQQEVHAQERRDYDAEAWIQPSSVAGAVIHVLDLPSDASIPEIAVRPGLV